MNCDGKRATVAVQFAENRCRMQHMHMCMVCGIFFRAGVRCHVFPRCTKVVRGPFSVHAFASSTDLPKYARTKYGHIIMCFRCLTVIHGPPGRETAHQPTGVTHRNWRVANQRTRKKSAEGTIRWSSFAFVRMSANISCSLEHILLHFATAHLP